MVNDSERYAEAEKALQEPFTAQGAQIETDRRPVKVVFSARIPAEYSQDIAEEAKRCDQTPSQLIADLVVEALATRKETAGASIPVAELQQLIARATHRSAA